MARPRTPIGAWGTINIRSVAPHTYEARAYLRCQDGRRRLVSARGPSKAKAKNRLLTRLQERSAAIEAQVLNPNTRIADLCALWIDRKQEEDVRIQTFQHYRSVIRTTIVPAIGDISLAEFTAARAGAFLDSLSPSTSDNARSVLKQAFALAVERDATATNPVAQLARKRTRHRKIETLTPQQLLELRTKIHAWAYGDINDEGLPTSKPRRLRAPELNDFLDLLVATGCRPGEIAALRWCDIDLMAHPPTVLICGTMINQHGKGKVRQPLTKTGTQRILTLPPFAVQTLTRIQREAPEIAHGENPVLPSPHGGHMSMTNWSRMWRLACRAAGGPDNPDRWAWVQMRTIRRTVATFIDRATSDSDAAALLGHTGTAVTHQHYIAARAQRAPDLSNILEQLAG